MRVRGVGVTMRVRSLRRVREGRVKGEEGESEVEVRHAHEGGRCELRTRGRGEVRHSLLMMIVAM